MSREEAQGQLSEGTGEAGREGDRGVRVVGAHRQAPAGSVRSLRKAHLISCFAGCSAKPTCFREGSRDTVRGSVPALELNSASFSVLLPKGQIAREEKSVVG